MAVDIPDWYKSRIEGYPSIDEVRVYKDCEQYVERALEEGATLVELNGFSELAMPVSDGHDTAVLTQDIILCPVPDPSYTTFITLERYKMSFNVSRQCASIPIWEPERILHHIHCTECELPLYKIADMYKGCPPIGLMCEDCARASNERYGYEM